MPLRINVPYKEKNEAKSKGAFWDNDLKTWYVPNHKNYNDFIKWIDTEKFNVIAKNPFYIGLNNRVCWKCREIIEVIALASDNFYTYDYIDEDDDENYDKAWFNEDYFSFFSMPDFIDNDSINLINQKFPFYKYGYSNHMKSRYWANHCQKCGALQGDFFNHNEPGGAFSPTSIDECKEITLIKVPSKFDLKINAGYAWCSIEHQILKNAKKINWEDID